MRLKQRIVKFVAVASLLVSSASNANEEQLDAVDLSQWSALTDSWSDQVTVVDYWATWCTSCLERFPAMARMSQEYEQVRFVSLLLEDPSDQASVKWARNFLAKHESEIDHYRMTDNLLTAFEALDLIAIPVVDVIGVDGERVVRLTGDDPNNQASDADVESAIRAALATDHKPQ